MRRVRAGVEALTGVLQAANPSGRGGIVQARMIIFTREVPQPLVTLPDFPDRFQIASLRKERFFEAPPMEVIQAEEIQVAPVAVPYQVRPVEEQPVVKPITVVGDTVVVASPPSTAEVPNPPIDKDQENPPPTVEVPEEI